MGFHGGERKIASQLNRKGSAKCRIKWKQNFRVHVFWNLFSFNVEYEI
jgi:hypothetical protein